MKKITKAILIIVLATLKIVSANNIGGGDEWVAVFYDNETRASQFVFNEELPSLGKNTLYTQRINRTTGVSTFSTYTVSVLEKMNVAFIPNKGLVEDQKKHLKLPFMSAYAADAKFFNKLGRKSKKFVALGIGDLSEMAFSCAAYAMKNNVIFDDAIFDFDGTEHLPHRKDYCPHKLEFGSTKLEIDENGKPSNYDINTSRLFQLIGKFRSEGSETLLGHCNANVCETIVQKISKDMNGVVYGHESYSYSSTLRKGKFYGTIPEIYNRIKGDGNSQNLGNYIKVSPDGKVSKTKGVRFSTNKKNAGEIKCD